jgi:hypothetical protein
MELLRQKRSTDSFDSEIIAIESPQLYPHTFSSKKAENDFFRPKAFKLLLLLLLCLNSAWAATITSTSSGGAWNSTGTWVGSTVPVSTDDVVVASGATVTTGGNRACNHLTINGTLTLANGNDLTVTGDFTNNGTFNSGGTSASVIFAGNNALQTVSGNNTAFNNIEVDKGSSYNNILDITCVITMRTNGLDVFNGTFKLSSASTITPFTGNPNLPSTAGFWNNGGTITATNGNSFSFDGLFRHSAGTMTIGNSSNDYLRYATGSSILIEGGSVSVAGALRPDVANVSTTTYNQSGGTFICGTSGTTSSAFGVFDLGRSGCSFTLSGGTIVIVRANVNYSGGDFNVLASSTNVTGGTLQIGNANTPASQTVQLHSLAPLYNLVINSTNSPVLQVINADIIIKNDLSIASGATFDPNGFNVTIRGDWTNNGTYNTGSSTISMTDSASQTISGSNTFYRWVLNKPTGSVTLSSSITVTNQMTFTKGIIEGSSSNLLILLDNVTVTGASDSSHINGAVRKVGNDAFVFPVGNGTYYAPISISAPSNTNQEFTAQYFFSPYVNTTSLSGINKVSSKEYWTLDRSANTNNVNVTLSFSNIRSSGVIPANLSDLRVARWDGSQWVSHGNGGTTYSAPDGTVITSSAVTSFSPFTLGSSAGLSPLPVQWLQFMGKSGTGKVSLLWSTASEYQSTYFAVEKSFNGQDWLEIGRVEAANYSNKVNQYLFDDLKPFDGIQYYRLKQFGPDGLDDISKSIQVMYQQISGTSVYPNPANTIVTIKGMKDVSAIVIFNALGQTCYENRSIQDEKMDIDISAFPYGLYTIELSGNGLIERLSIFKQ